MDVQLELRTNEVNIPEVKTSCEYVTELRERLEDSLKLPRKNYRNIMIGKPNLDIWK